MMPKRKNILFSYGEKMEDAQIGLLAVVASALIFLVTLVFGPVIAPNLPQDAVLHLYSLFNLPAASYNISPDSISFYVIYGFVASVISLGVDFAIFFGLRARS